MAKIIQATDTTVELPSGDFLSQAEFLRDGADLVLNAPGGESIMIEDYFATESRPDITSPEGGRLSPEMVEAFLPPQHVGEYAANNTMNDESPVGQISDMSGQVYIVRADGTRVEAEAGTVVFPGDVIETSADGAANLTFVDNTTFSISDNARMSVDEFTYDAADQSGSTFFSMLQGVFVYTSGLVGKSDPANVNIETPVGSIGIRGTVVAGDIAPAGEQSTITLVDGAIVLTNAGGTVELNESFSHAVMNSHQDMPKMMGKMNTNTFTKTYQSVSSMAKDTFDNLDNFAGNDNNNDAPATETQDNAAEDTPPTSEDAPPEEAPPPQETANDAPQDPVDAPPAEDAPVLLDPAGDIPLPPPPESDFGDDTINFGDDAPPPPPPPGGTTGDATPPPPPPTNNNGNDDNTDTEGPANYALRFEFSAAYAETGHLDIAKLLDTAPGKFVIGHVTGNSELPADTVYTLVTNDLNVFPVTTLSGTGFTPNSGTNVGAASRVIFRYDPNTGELSTDAIDGAAAFEFLNGIGDHELTIVAHQGSINGPIIAEAQGSFTIKADPRLDGIDSLADIQVGTMGDDASIVGTTEADFINGRDGNDFAIEGNGGADIIFGGDGNDTIIVADDEFVLVDGGDDLSGFGDTLTLGLGATPRLFDISDMGEINNIETLELGVSGPGGIGQSVELTVEDIFNMTDSGNTLQLRSSALYSSSTDSNVHLDLGEWTINPATVGNLNMSTGELTGGLVMTGLHNGQTVSLTIFEATSQITIIA